MKRIEATFFLFLVLSPLAWAQNRVILDIAPGSGMEDAISLAGALLSADLEISGIVISGASPEERARVACHLVSLCAREDVPVIVGSPALRDSGPGSIWAYSSRFHDIVPVSEPGLEILSSLLNASQDNPVTYVATGPLSSLGAVLASAPELAPAVGRLVWTLGSRGGWDNLERDYPAAETALSLCPRVLILAPEIAGSAFFTRSELETLLKPSPVPLVKGLRGMLQFAGSPERVFLGNALVMEYAGNSRLFEERPVPRAGEFPSFLDSNPRVRILTGRPPVRFSIELGARLTDDCTHILIHIRSAISWLESAPPNVTAPLASRIHDLAAILPAIRRGDRLRVTARQRHLAIVHRAIQRLELAHGFEPVRRAAIRLSIVSSIFSGVHLLTGPTHAQTGAFRGIRGGRAFVEIGFANDGPFELVRARLQIRDWTGKTYRTESFLNIKAGSRDIRSIELPVPMRDEYPLLRMVDVVAGYQFENSWAALNQRYWVQVLSPFEMRLSGPVNSEGVSVEVVANTTIPALGIEAFPVYGDWSVTGTPVSLSFVPSSGSSFEIPGLSLLDPGPVFSSPRTQRQTVRFGVRGLEKEHINLLRIVARADNFGATQEAVVPHRGANVVWMRIGSESPLIRQVGGRWATSTRTGRGLLHYSVNKEFLSAADTEVWVDVEFFEQPGVTDSFILEYDSVYPLEEGGALRQTPPVRKYGRGIWRHHRFVLEGAHFAGRQPRGSDFRINDLGDGEELIGWVAVRMPEEVPSP